MNVDSEFSKYASHYGAYNIIQNKVVKKLLNDVKTKDKRIIDLGCGSGAVCKNIKEDYNYFTAIDFAKGMLELHPKSDKIDCVCFDFNDESLFKSLKNYDLLISSSALQWADDLDKVLSNIKSLNIPVYLAIFSSGTFTTINKTAGLEPLLRDAKTLKTLAQKYFDCKFEIVNYKLEFDSTRDMFRYIKKSGVSGARNLLSYKETKKLMNAYPLNYLEFEVCFITSH